MHYLNGRPANDTSGLVLHLSGKAVDYSAGMAAFAASFVIPPRTPRTLAPNACCYSGWEPLHGFAARVHTHGMGRCASGTGAGCAWAAACKGSWVGWAVHAVQLQDPGNQRLPEP